MTVVDLERRVRATGACISAHRRRGVWSLAATRDRELVAHAAAPLLEEALGDLLADLDALDARVPPAPAVPAEARDFLPTVPAR